MGKTKKKERKGRFLLIIFSAAAIAAICLPDTIQPLAFQFL